MCCDEISNRWQCLKPSRLVLRLFSLTLLVSWAHVSMSALIKEIVTTVFFFFQNVTFAKLKFSPRIKYQTCSHALNPHACYCRKRHLPFLMIGHRSCVRNLHLSKTRFIGLFVGVGQPRRTMHGSPSTPLQPGTEAHEWLQTLRGERHCTFLCLGD